MTNKTIFRSIIGTSPESKVLEYLSEWKEYDMTLTEIARGAEIGRAGAYRVINNLVKEKMLLLTREYGRCKLYSLDRSHEVVEELFKLFNIVMKHNIKKVVKRHAK